MTHAKLASPPETSRPAPADDAGQDERSQQIIEATYELLGDSGLDGLTIRAVLARTGLARRAFYERFAGKDDLVLAVFEYAVRMAAGLYSAQSATLADPLERLRWIITAIVQGRSESEESYTEETRRRGAALSREHLRLAEARPADLQAALEPLIAVMARNISDGIAAGLIRPCDPHRHAMLIYNLISTTMQIELMADEASRLDSGRRHQLEQDLWEFCRRALSS